MYRFGLVFVLGVVSGVLSDDNQSNSTCDEVKYVSPKKYPQLAFVCVKGHFDDLHFESSDTLNACSTGVIISPNYVIDSRPHDCDACNYSVRIGLDQGGKTGAEYQAELIKHENYTEDGYSTGFVSPYNIVLYKLNESIKFDSNVQPIGMLENGKVPESGDQGTYLDWAIEYGNRVDSEISEVNLTVISSQDCRKLFKHWYPASIQESNPEYGIRLHNPEIQELPDGLFCTKVPSYDFCLGTRSPKLLIQGQLAGLLIHSDFTDDELHTVSVYVDVSKHKSWIQSHIATSN